MLDEAARQKMASLQYVTEVEPEIRVMGQIVYSGQTHFGFVTGLPMSARENEAFDNLARQVLLAIRCRRGHPA